MSIYKKLELRHLLYRSQFGGARRRRRLPLHDPAYLNVQQYRASLAIQPCHTEAARQIFAKRRAAYEC